MFILPGPFPFCLALSLSIYSTPIAHDFQHFPNIFFFFRTDYCLFEAFIYLRFRIASMCKSFGYCLAHARLLLVEMKWPNGQIPWATFVVENLNYDPIGFQSKIK